MKRQTWASNHATVTMQQGGIRGGWCWGCSRQNKTYLRHGMVFVNVRNESIEINKLKCSCGLELCPHSRAEFLWVYLLKLHGPVITASF